MGRLHVGEDGKVKSDELWQPKNHHRLCTCHFNEPPNPKRRTAGWNHRIPDLCRLEPKKEATHGLTKARSDQVEAEVQKAQLSNPQLPLIMNLYKMKLQSSSQVSKQYHRGTQS